MAICLALERQLVARPFSRACEKTGNRIPARMAMIATTVRSSINVKPRVAFMRFLPLAQR